MKTNKNENKHHSMTNKQTKTKLPPVLAVTALQTMPKNVVKQRKQCFFHDFELRFVVESQVEPLNKIK